MFSVSQLKAASVVSLPEFCLSLEGFFILIHTRWSTMNFLKPLCSIHPRQLLLFLCLGSFLFSGHILHVALYYNFISHTSVDPFATPEPQTFLLDRAFIRLGISVYIFSMIEACVFYENLGQSFIQQLTFIFTCASLIPLELTLSFLYLALFLSEFWNILLSAHLFLLGFFCNVVCEVLSRLLLYPYCLSDYFSTPCLFVHHFIVSAALYAGTSSHFTVFVLREQTLHCELSYVYDCFRDSLLSLLTWLICFLGLHSVGLILHNDMLQAFGRFSDMFFDMSIQLKPLGSWLLEKLDFLKGIVFSPHSFSQVLTSLKIAGTSDFLVHHTHAFTTHVSIYVLVKGNFYSRTSKLISGKLALGFSFPCDGPGRGGSCMTSSWDHLFLGLF